MNDGKRLTALHVTNCPTIVIKQWSMVRLLIVVCADVTQLDVECIQQEVWPFFGFALGIYSLVPNKYKSVIKESKVAIKLYLYLERKFRKDF